MSSNETTTYAVSLGDGADVHMTVEQIGASFRAGTLHERTMIWREGMPVWLTLADLAGELGIEMKRPDPATISQVMRTVAARPPIQTRVHQAEEQVTYVFRWLLGLFAVLIGVVIVLLLAAY